jgi:hypothetical protein
MTRRFLFTLAAGAAVAAGLSGSALADPGFGQNVAACAQATLGQRDNPPAVTCTCAEASMTFANFGAMVEHMRTQG